MGLRLKKADLDSLLKKTTKKEITSSKSGKKTEPKNQIEEVFGTPKKDSEPTRQLKQAIRRLSDTDPDDSIFFNEDNTKCILYFKDVSLISSNISLRLGARRMNEYKQLWHKRVEKLVDNESLKKWEKSKEKKALIEFCYEVKGNFLDFDGKMGSFKAPLDGLVEAGLLYDDKDEHVDFILPMQARTKTKNPNLIIMITAVEEESSLFSEDFKEFLNTKD